MVSTPSDFLSKEYLDFNINKFEDVDINLKDITNQISSYDNTLIYKVENSSNSKGIYYSKNYIFKLNLKEGRIFNQNDFKYNTNTVLISSNILNKIEIKDGKRCILHNNNYYEVIGVYQKSSNKINLDSDYYFNLLAKNNFNYSDIDGNFLLDTDEYNIMSIFESIGYININKRMNDNNFIEKLEKVMSVQCINIITVVLIILLIFLSTIGTTTSWVESRKNELMIRFLSGANYNMIKRMLVKEYIYLITCSFIIGYIISYFISSLDFKVFVVFNFSLITLIISFTMTMILGLISTIIMIKSYKKLIVLS